MNVSPPVVPVVVRPSLLSLAELTRLMRLMTQAAEAGRPCPVQIQQ